jgi:acyl carrier protein
MTHTQWQSSVQAKVVTSWNLHNLLPRGLDFFVLLSSLAGVYGNVSQANYAAGNTFQDALAEARRSQGEEAVSINLGWMRTIGAISEKEEYQNFRMKGADMAKIEEQELLSLLASYCDSSHGPRTGLRSHVLMGTVTPGDLLSKGVAVSASMKRPLFSTFATCAGSTMIADSGDGTDLAGLFKQAKDIGEKEKLVSDALAQKLARSLSVLPEDINRQRPLFEYGVDSLVAVELRNWLGKEFEADVPVFDIMGGATIAAMGVLTVKNSRVTP